MSTVCFLRRARGDDGAAAVEFALLFPIFMVLAMGTIAVGTAFSRQINVTQAAREASRYGATYDIAASHVTGGTNDGTISTWLPLVDGAACQAVNNGNACSSTQAANPLAGYDYRCVAIITRTPADAIDTSHTAFQETYTGSASTTQLSSSTGCPTVTTPDFGANSRVVQVVLTRDVRFNLLLISPTLHVDGVSTSPYEGTLP